MLIYAPVFNSILAFYGILWYSSFPVLIHWLNNDIIANKIPSYQFNTGISPSFTGRTPATGWCVPGFLNLFLCRRLYICVHAGVCVCLCVCPPPRLSITNGVIWTPYDWLNKFYSLYVPTVVSIINGCGLGIDMYHGN